MKNILLGGLIMNQVKKEKPSVDNILSRMREFVDKADNGLGVYTLEELKELNNELSDLLVETEKI